MKTPLLAADFLTVPTVGVRILTRRIRHSSSLLTYAYKFLFPFLGLILIFQIIKDIFIGPVQCAWNTKHLLSLGITHVLNVSTIEYTKRTHYFKYYNLDVYNAHDEDIKKFFRITNRFIEEVASHPQKIEI